MVWIAVGIIDDDSFASVSASLTSVVHVYTASAPVWNRPELWAHDGIKRISGLDDGDGDDGDDVENSGKHGCESDAAQVPPCRAAAATHPTVRSAGGLRHRLTQYAAKTNARATHGRERVQIQNHVQGGVASRSGLQHSEEARSNQARQSRTSRRSSSPRLSDRVWPLGTAQSILQAHGGVHESAGVLGHIIPDGSALPNTHCQNHDQSGENVEDIELLEAIRQSKLEAESEHYKQNSSDAQDKELQEVLQRSINETSDFDQHDVGEHDAMCSHPAHALRPCGRDIAETLADSEDPGLPDEVFRNLSERQPIHVLGPSTHSDDVSVFREACSAYLEQGPSSHDRVHLRSREASEGTLLGKRARKSVVLSAPVQMVGPPATIEISQQPVHLVWETGTLCREKAIFDLT